MPSKSPAQARFMAAAAHDPAFAKKAGIPQGVAREFNQADEGTGIRKSKAKASKGPYISGSRAPRKGGY